MENKKKTKYLHVLLAFILAAIVLCPASVSAASQKTPRQGIPAEDFFFRLQQNQYPVEEDIQCDPLQDLLQAVWRQEVDRACYGKR